MGAVRSSGWAGVCLVLASALVGCGPGSSPQAEPSATTKQALVRVPQDASLAEAGDLVADGGVVLIDAGTYHESLQTSADDVTIRGVDRNEVVLDGELDLSHGVVATGARVAVENLTVRNYLQNGVLVTGMTDETGAGVARGPEGYIAGEVPDPVPGYLVQSVTAENNGLYGIYAFNRTGGVIRDNLATGGSDSGIYIGQCARCDSLVEGNVVESNAVGLEFANASHVRVTGNRIVRNRVGISVLSNYLEAHGPTTGMQIVGNVIADNDNDQTPEQASGGYGIGIGLGGTVGVEVRANRITGQANAGVWVTSSEDFAPTDNVVGPGLWAGNGSDVVLAPQPGYAGSGNCFELAGARRSIPSALLDDGCGDRVEPGSWTQPVAPAGISFAEVPRSAPRPGLDDAGEDPRTVPDAAPMPDLGRVRVPAAGLLAGTAG